MEEAGTGTRFPPRSTPTPVSGLFAPVESLPQAAQVVAKILPLTYAVSLLEGIWKGDAWWAHARDLTALAGAFVVCTALSAKVFRWE